MDVGLPGRPVRRLDDVARRPDVGHVRAQVVVDRDAPVRRDARALEEFDVGLHAGRRSAEVCRHHLTRRQSDPGCLSIAVDEAGRLDAEPELDSTISHRSRGDLGRLGIEHPGHHPGAPSDHRDPDAEIGEQQRDLHPDEAGSDDHGRTRLTASHPPEDGLGGGQGLEVVNAAEFRALDRSMQAAAGRDQEGVIVDGRSISKEHTMAGRIDAGDDCGTVIADTQAIADVPAFPEERFGATSQCVVGECRWRIGGIWLASHHLELDRGIGRAERLGGDDAGRPGPDDEDLHAATFTERAVRWSAS